MFPFKKILCPTDFTEPALCNLKLANEMAQKFGSEITVLNVHKTPQVMPATRLEAPDIAFDYSEHEKQTVRNAEEAMAKVKKNIFGEDVKTQLVVCIGKPSHEILRVADEMSADAIFICTHNRTKLAQLIFGSVADQLIGHTKCPIVTIPVGE